MRDLPSLKQKAIQSGKWALVARVSQVLGGAVTLIVLPFWLTPDDFGIITMFSSIFALIIFFQQFGLTEVTVQSEEESQQVRDSAFWINGLVSVCLYFVVFILAPYISLFFNEPRLVLVLRVASIQIVFMGISNIPIAWLQREFQYRSYALIQFVSSVVMIVVSLTLAVLGKGYFSYIIGLLSSIAVRFVLSVIYMDWRPAFRFESQIYRRIFGFSIFVFLEMILGWLLVWFDNLVVAKNIGNSAAGIYSLAFNFANIAIALPISTITGVTLPAFSRLQNDVAALRSAYLNGTEIIASYVIPAGVGLSLLGPDLLRIIYPGQWNDISIIFPVLALYAGFGHLWILNTDLFKAIGKPVTMLKVYIPVVLLMMPIYWWSSKLGLLEFSIARSSIVLISAIPHSYFIAQVLHIRVGYILKIIKTPVMASVIMSIVLFLSKGFLQFFGTQDKLGAFIYLVILIFVGFGVYWRSMIFLNPVFSAQIRSIILQSVNGYARK